MTQASPVRVLVAGKQGQIARCLADVKRPDILVVAAGRPEMDITDATSVARMTETIKPDIVVNAAAYTAVDNAEDDAENTRLVNEVGASILSAAAARIGVPIVHISTDYVFSGEKRTPYVETDPCEPLSVYGKTKLAGEIAVRAANPQHVILRTAWVYSEHGSNFLNTMLRLAKDRPIISVVDDQWGSPTYARDLAEALISVCETTLSKETDWAGTYHIASDGVTNWAAFATEIFRQSAAMGGQACEVEPISMAQYPTRAKRPRFSALDTSKFTTRFGHRMSDWKVAISPCLHRAKPEG